MRRGFVLVLILMLWALSGAFADATESADAAYESLPKDPKQPTLAEMMGFKSPDSSDKKAPAVPLADQFKALGSDLPALGVIPFTATSAIDPQWAVLAQKEMVRQIITRKLDRPFALADWLKTAFGTNKAASMRSILKAAKSEYVLVNLMMTGYLFQSGNELGLRVSIYYVDIKKDPVHFLRFFTSVDQIPGLCSQIASELTTRPAKPETKVPVYKGFWLNAAVIGFSSYTALATGEFSFGKLPFLRRDGVDYKPSDDYFTDLLGYSLYSTRMASVVMNDAPAWCGTSQSIKQDADYVVNTQIMMSDVLSAVTFAVFDTSNGTEVLHLSMPLREVTMASMAQVMRTAAKMILFAVSSDKEHASMGVVVQDPPVQKNPEIYCENYFIGDSAQDLVLPIGLNVMTFGPAYNDKQLVRNPPLSLMVYPFADPLKLTDLETRYFRALTAGGAP